MSGLAELGNLLPIFDSAFPQVSYLWAVADAAMRRGTTFSPFRRPIATAP